MHSPEEEVQTKQNTDAQEMWATIQLMGHAQTAGRISRPSDWGGLLRVDKPTPDGGYSTSFYGMAAIYSIDMVSEAIARAFASPSHVVVAYDTPIITREQHRAEMSRMADRAHELEHQVAVLQGRLTAVQSLPAPAKNPESDDELCDSCGENDHNGLTGVGYDSSTGAYAVYLCGKCLSLHKQAEQREEDRVLRK